MLVKCYLSDNINVQFEEVVLAFQMLGPAWLYTIFKKDFGILMRVGMEGKRQLINFKLKKVTNNSSHSSYQPHTLTRTHKRQKERT